MADVTQGWQPIETAPKDGADILLLLGETIPDRPYVQCGSYIDEVEASNLGQHAGWMIWHERGEDWWIEYPEKPTHWMPLPAPPTPR